MLEHLGPSVEQQDIIKCHAGPTEFPELGEILVRGSEKPNLSLIGNPEGLDLLVLHKPIEQAVRREIKHVLRLARLLRNAGCTLLFEY